MFCVYVWLGIFRNFDSFIKNLDKESVVMIRKEI